VTTLLLVVLALGWLALLGGPAAAGGRVPREGRGDDALGRVARGALVLARLGARPSPWEAGGERSRADGSALPRAGQGSNL